MTTTTTTSRWMHRLERADPSLDCIKAFPKWAIPRLGTFSPSLLAWSLFSPTTTMFIFLSKWTVLRSITNDSQMRTTETPKRLSRGYLVSIDLRIRCDICKEYFLNNDYLLNFISDTLIIWIDESFYLTNEHISRIILIPQRIMKINFLNSWFCTSQSFQKFKNLTKDLDIRLSYYNLNKLENFIKTHKDSLSISSKKNVLYKMFRKNCDMGLSMWEITKNRNFRTVIPAGTQSFLLSLQNLDSIITMNLIERMWKF